MTLKAFIHGLGFCLCALMGAGALYLDARMLRETRISQFAGVVLPLVIVNGLAILVCRRLWQMGLNWSREVIADYADIQALLTGLALGQFVPLFWAHGPKQGWGLIFFLCLRGLLRRFLERHFGFDKVLPSPSHEEREQQEVAGTPWENDPGYTAR